MKWLYDELLIISEDGEHVAFDTTKPIAQVICYDENGNPIGQPLTGAQIPMFVSTSMNKDFYLGIPALRDEDMLYAKNAGFEIINIFPFIINIVYAIILKKR